MEPNNSESTAAQGAAQSGAEPTQSGAQGAAQSGAQGFTQADIDNAVNAAVAAAQEQWKADADEAAELAKLSKDAREKKLFEKEKSKFETEKAQFAHEKLILETQRQLAGKSLPTEFADMLTGKDANATLKNIEAFETAYAKAVEDAVNKRLKADPPTVGYSTAQADPFLAGFGG